MRRDKKRNFVGPRQEAPVGSTWMLDVGNDGNYVGIAVVVGEKNVPTGNYPVVMLWCTPQWKTRPGQRFNAAVTTARWWRRLD